MKNYRSLLRNLLQDDSGQDLIEYALIAGLISLAAVGTMSGIATSISTIFTTISTNLATAAG